MNTKALRQAARRLGLSIGANFFHAAQGGFCPICDKLIILGEHNTSFDHVHPLKETSDDHQLHQGNLLLTHEKCNRKKGNNPATRHEIHMLAIVNHALDFDEGTGAYGRRKSFLNSYRNHRDEIEDQIAVIEQKLEESDKAFDHLQEMRLKELQGNLEHVDSLIDHQLRVFHNYELFDRK